MPKSYFENTTPLSLTARAPKKREKKGKTPSKNKRGEAASGAGRVRSSGAGGAGG
jgi:hypothetical protein